MRRGDTGEVEVSNELSSPPHLVSFEWRPDEDDGSHGGDHVIGRDMLHLNRGGGRGNVPISSTNLTADVQLHINQYRLNTDALSALCECSDWWMVGFQTPGLHSFYWPPKNVFGGRDQFLQWKQPLLFLSRLSHIIKVSIIKPDAGVSGELSWLYCCPNTDVVLHTPLFFFFFLLSISIWCELSSFRCQQLLPYKKKTHFLDLCFSCYLF